MEKQICFAQAEYADKKRVTRRERFLEEMERVAPWARLAALIEPDYPKALYLAVP
jgi:transposase, IS5 family